MLKLSGCFSSPAKICPQIFWASSRKMLLALSWNTFNQLSSISWLGRISFLLTSNALRVIFSRLICSWIIFLTFCLNALLAILSISLFIGGGITSRFTTVPPCENSATSVFAERNRVISCKRFCSCSMSISFACSNRSGHRQAPMP